MKLLKQSLLIATAALASFNANAITTQKQTYVFNANIYNDLPSSSVSMYVNGVGNVTLHSGQMRDVIYSNSAPQVAIYKCQLFNNGTVTMCGNNPGISRFTAIRIEANCALVEHTTPLTVLYCGHPDAVTRAVRQFPTFQDLVKSSD